MNTNDTRPIEPSDDEILAGVHRHLTDAEPLIPLTKAWAGGDVTRPREVRTSVRSRVGFGGFAPFVAIAAVLVIVVGAGLGSRSFGWGGGGPTGPTGYTIVYQLQGTAAHPVTQADLDTTASVLEERLNSISIGAQSIEKLPPDELAVHLPLGSNVEIARQVLDVTGQLAFVLLPKATYGDVTSPGSVAVPVAGSSLDPALLATAEFTGADLDPNAISASEGPVSPGFWVINFAFGGTKASEFEAWSGRHINEYFAIVLDGRVMSVPYIKSAIVGGSGQISGDFNEAGAKLVAAYLRYGPLPCPVQEVSFLVDGVVQTSQPSPPVSVTVTLGTFAAADSNGPIVAPSVTTPTDIPSSGRTLGSPSAPVTIDIWIDYQDPNSRDFELQIMPQLIERYVRPGKARIVVHDMIVIDVIGGGVESAHAAAAARCAGDQGKFWQYQDWLWANQEREGSGTFSDDRLIGLAGNVGLDTQAFSQCLTDGTHAAEVQAESSAAGSAGITGIPAIKVNGALVQSYDFETVSAAIEAAAASSSVAPASPR
ncbi:MAG TPA: thioredoxin domain-containing protein [Candidatus Limnocylindrales bacterium]